LTEEEKKYVSLMRDWNLRCDADANGATVFKCIWDSLETVIWGDEFKQSKLPMTWPDPSTLVESLIKDSAYAFAYDITTKNKVETIQADVMLAVKKAAVNLRYLENNRSLAWAKYKDTRVNHLLKLPSLSRLHLPIGGGTHMINATKSDHGPSWRMIVHLTDDIEAYGVYPGGQNGNPGSRYYDSFVDSWAAGKYYRLLFLKRADASKHERIKWHITFTNS
jgi:penicillin amidase